MRALMKAALDTAKEQGADIENAVAFGYCFGGAAVLELARSGENLKGFATFHGGLQTPEGQNYSIPEGKYPDHARFRRYGDHHGPVCGFDKELEAAGVPHEMISYGGADHAFTVFGGRTLPGIGGQKILAVFFRFSCRHVENKYHRMCHKSFL